MAGVLVTVRISDGLESPFTGLKKKNEKPLTLDAVTLQFIGCGVLGVICV